MHEFSSEDGLRAESAQLTGIFPKFGWGVACWALWWERGGGSETLVQTTYTTNLSPDGFPKGEGSVTLLPV